jgi:uncharacterized membrane protein HdeD (DUF308 family)
MTAATTAPEAPDQYHDMMVQLGRSWGLVLAFGILSILIGLFAIFLPGPTLVTLAILFAIQLFISGIFSIMRAFAHNVDTGGRILSLIIGILGVIIGFALLREPFQSVIVIAFVIGIFWVAHGIIELVGAFSNKVGRNWAVFFGIVSIIAGFIILEYPIASIATLALVVGIWLVILGIMEIFAAFQLRNAARKAAAV